LNIGVQSKINGGPDRSILDKDIKKYSLVSRRYRNRRIGEFLKELDMTEGKGAGFPKILRALKKNESPKPVFHTDDDRSYFVVELPIQPKFLQVTDSETEQVTEQVKRLVFVISDKALGTRDLKGSACRRKSVLSALEKYSMFHFAGHAVIEESQQDMSRLLLSDGALRVSGLFGRKIKSRFVFLNGCQTARGKVLPGDEMNSFSRAFHFAGADEVIVNLWEVSDSHSPIMTKLFYESFSRGLSSERALQQAQKQAIADGLSPFVWAAIKVIK